MSEPTAKTPFANPRDPLLKAASTTDLEVYRRLAQALPDNVPISVAMAGLRILMADLMRTSHAKLDTAQGSVDQHMAEVKRLVALHYDATGRRRNGVFAFDQVIEIPHMDFRIKG